LGTDWVWPQDRDRLVEVQQALAELAPPAWSPPDSGLSIGGCYVCFPRDHTGPGALGDPAWAAAAVLSGRRRVGHHVTFGIAGGPYEPGLLALRMGAVLEAAVRGLPEPPDVLLVDATGRDHPRRAGLALHLGAALDIPTVGVTHRTLVATGTWPEDHLGATSPLTLDGEIVGYWTRTRPGVRPLAVHAAWRTHPGTAVEVVRRSRVRSRTPEPLREARRLARVARQQAQ
jgi:deoxyribonuclease V